ncbi:MAG: DUF2306 domain-containing protein [Lewinella sp.]|uniref:DUF2306 domain-containing protein n=1 Tax=Lewinella sp. TaxID=2004506 RepID=UPI003D6C35E4
MANNKNRTLLRGGKYLLLAILLFFTYRMALLSWPYLGFDDRVAFLRIKQSVIHISWWKVAFYVHVFTSILLLLAGFTQFSGELLKRYPGVHRGAGKLYVFVLLFLSGPAGLLLAIKANGGVWSQLAFTTLAVLWWWFTWQAWRSIIKGQLKAHQDFMWRSFALTLSAVTLRSWKWLVVLVWAPPPMDTYRLVAWLGWVPNLLLVEWWIRRKKTY